MRPHDGAAKRPPLWNIRFVFVEELFDIMSEGFEVCCVLHGIRSRLFYACSILFEEEGCCVQILANDAPAGG